MDQKATPRGMYNCYSVAFKMKIVKEIENSLISINAARELYNINSKNTISEWVAKYCRNQRINKTVYIMTNEEQLELIKLKKENLRLQKALDDSQLHKLAMETLIEIIEKSSSEN